MTAAKRKRTGKNSCFNFYEKPDLNGVEESVPDGDYIIKTEMPIHYVSIDPSGKLGWKNCELIYNDTHACVLEVLTGKAENVYKAFLRKLEIPYIIAGERELDYELALRKLKELFGIETLMLGGGGILNWSFIQAGMCDEISVIIAPTADGSSDTPALFTAKEGIAPNIPVGFDLQSADVKEGGSVWLRYLVKRSIL